MKINPANGFDQLSRMIRLQLLMQATRPLWPNMPNPIPESVQVAASKKLDSISEEEWAELLDLSIPATYSSWRR